MEKVKHIFEKIIIWGLILIIIINFTHNFSMSAVVTFPQILYLVSAFLCFALLVQIYFFVHVFTRENRTKKWFIWKNVLMLILLIIWAIGVLFFIFWSHDFVDFIGESHKNGNLVGVIIWSISVWVFLTIDLIMYWILIFIFFKISKHIEKQESPITLQKQ